MVIIAFKEGSKIFYSVKTALIAQVGSSTLNAGGAGLIPGHYKPKLYNMEPVNYYAWQTATAPVCR